LCTVVLHELQVNCNNKIIFCDNSNSANIDARIS